MSGSQTCSVDATGNVTCTLSSSASSIDFGDLLYDAQAVNSAINSNTPMLITAFGGAGGNGSGGSSSSGGAGGSGGSAQMVTTLASLTSAYGATTIYYY